MFWNDKKTQLAAFDFFRQKFGYDRSMSLLEIDFQKPWWHIFRQQKKLVLLNTLNVTILSIATSLTPFWLAQAFTSNNHANLIVLISALICIRIVTFGLFYFDPLLRIQSMKSLENSANNFFLTVDPLYHTMRSTGQIVAKVTRGANSLDSLVDIIQFNILSSLGSIIGVMIAFANIGGFYWLYLGIFLFLLIGCNTFAFVARTKLFRKIRLQTEDISKSASLEILQQAQYVRAVFASKEQFDKVSDLQQKSMLTQATLWRTGAYIITVTQVAFLVSLMLAAVFLVKRTDLDQVIVMSLLLSYFQIGESIQAVGSSVSRSVRALEDVTDLYDFIRGFGTQSFPVLETKSNQHSQGARVTPAV